MGMYEERSKSALTLVEVLFAALLSSIVLVALFSFFGDSMQKFVQHEDTLTEVSELQLMLAHLRRDTSMLRGERGRDSSSSYTGTTFPKQYLHICHDRESDSLKCFSFGRENDESPIPDNAPLEENLPENEKSEALLDSIAFLENACAFVTPSLDSGDDEAPCYLIMNIERGGQEEQVLYTYSKKERCLKRSESGSGELEVFARGSLESFSARPVFEFLTYPSDPNKTAVLLKYFIEYSFSLKASEDGGTIEKRSLSFTSKVTPRALNSKLKSIWSQ